MKREFCEECNSALINDHGKLICHYCGKEKDFVPIMEEEDEENE